ANALGTTAGGTVVANGANLTIANVAIGAEAVTLNGGNALTGTGTASLAGNVTLGANSTIATTASGDSLTLSGTIGDGGGGFGFQKTGAGTLILSGANTYSGGTGLAAGTLSLQNNSALGTNNLTIGGAAVVDYGNGISIANAIDVAAAGAQFQVVTGTATQSGAIDDSGLNLGIEKIGTGTLTLSGANTYAGLTTVTGGTLVAANATALGTTAAGTTVAAGANLTIANVAIGAEAVTLNGGNALTGTGTASLAGNVTLNASSTVTVDGADALTLSGVIGDGGGGFGLSKVGAGTLTLSGNNTYTGTTNVTGGTLVNSGTLASAVVNAATFNNNATGTVSGLVTNTAGTTTNAGQLNGGVSVTGGTFANTATGIVNGGLNNAATTSNAGTINGGVTNSGTFTQTGGSTNGGLTNTATVNANGGAINGAIANNAGGTFNVGGTVTSDSTFTNADGATLAVGAAGDYTVAGLLTNAGALTVAAGGVLTATANGLTNTATGNITNNGTINDDLDNAGSVTNNGVYNANVATNTGTITNNLTWNGSVLSNTSGTITNSVGATWIGDANNNGGTLNNAGTWTGNVTNSGVFTTTGTVNGAVANTGTTNAQGTITGAIANNAGTFNLTGALAIGAALTNAAGATLNATTAGTTNVTSAGALAIANAGTFNAGAVAGQGGSVTSITSGGVQTFTNSGIINVRGTANFTGAAGSTFTNQAGGVISMVNGNVSDTTNVSGTYAGAAGSQVAVDVNLSDTNVNPAVRKSDLLNAGQTTGSSTIVFNRTPGQLVFLANPIPVVTSGAGSTGNFTATGLPNTGLVAYSLAQTAPGTWSIVSTVNTGAIAATSTSITAAIASIDAGFHQPASALVASAASQQPDKWSGGPWIRFNAGTSKVDSVGTAVLPASFGLPPQTADSRVRTNFAGFQGGFDSGLLNIGGSGINVHIGATAGYVNATARELNTVQNGTPLSSSVDFDIPFVGAYIVATYGSFFTDFMVRRDYYNLRVSNNLAGVTDRHIDGHATNFNGSMGYHFDVGGSWFIEPQVGLSYTRSHIDPLVFNTVNATLTFNTLESLLGRAGVRVGTAFLASERLALQPFVTLSVWHEFKDKAGSLFNQFDPNTGLLAASVPVSTTRVGTFGQIGVGMSGQILQTGWVGFVRGDMRFGEDIQGAALVVGFRNTFAAN
ncbi:MAG TPA: autotransporter outer membrane beta-barrel domain-containing protein, partial [Xanthobacteraceae bacterium]|nr:autotransporter outer membrane beta-barrel domain-containing protein [Xanthobacteraceae bacterium]